MKSFNESRLSYLRWRNPTKIVRESSLLQALTWTSSMKFFEENFGVKGGYDLGSLDLWSKNGLSKT